MAPAERLETWGNPTTMNMNQILYQNIMNSSYFKSLYALKTVDEVVNDIVDNVTHLEPFLARSSTVSSGMCLLFKLWTLKVTVNQMTRMLEFEGSPFVRLMGFLYLRYTYPTDKLLDWFADFIDDNEEVKVDESPSARPTTVGAVVRRLLTEKKYFTTMLPTIPVKAAKAIEEFLKEHPPQGAAEKAAVSKGQDRRRSRSRSRDRRRSRSRSRDRRRSRSRSRDRRRSRSRSRDRRRSRSRDRRRSRSRSRDRRRSRSGDRRRDRSRSRDRYRRDRSRSRDRR